MRYQRITPTWLIKKLCGDVKKDNLVLEPSAGEGLICDYIVKLNANCHCFELNNEKRKILKEADYVVLGADFLKHSPVSSYDFVIMCPPFQNNKDVFHVMHAYKYLKKDGVLKALMNPSFITENNTHQKEFREFLIDKQYSIELIPDYTFIEKSKTVSTIIITIKSNENTI